MPILGILGLALVIAACDGSDTGQTESHDEKPFDGGSATGTPDARWAGLPGAVLDGTDVVELSGLEVLSVDDSISGTYSVDQGGAVLATTLVETADGWQLIRTHTEPGWPTDEAVYFLQQDQYVLRSADENVTVALSRQGLLVLERGKDVVPPDLWVLYRREP